MAVRSTMAALITRVRLLINDPSGGSQQFADQDIQDILDANRSDVQYLLLAPYPTYSGATISYLDYYADLGDWEDDTTFWQYRTIQVTPSINEPIVGHWRFTTSTLPPIFMLGKTYDVYRGAADLLERWSVRWALSYNINVDGQSLQRSQVSTALMKLAEQYRRQQRAVEINAMRGDVNQKGEGGGYGLGPTEIDYMGAG